jgi:hypothetical protein
MAHTAGSKLFLVDLALNDIVSWLRAVRATSYLLVRGELCGKNRA